MTYSARPRRRSGLDDHADEILYVQDQYWVSQTAPTPPTTACGKGWDSTTVLASNPTNTYQGQSRPLFTYNSSDPLQINVESEGCLITIFRMFSDQFHHDVVDDIGNVRTQGS